MELMKKTIAWRDNFTGRWQFSWLGNPVHYGFTRDAAIGCAKRISDCDVFVVIKLG